MIFVLAASIASLALAGCNRDTSAAKEPATLLGGLAISAFHVDGGGSTAPATGRAEQMSEGRFALAICRWPSTTIAYVSALSDAPSITGYVVAGSDGYHPQLFVSSRAWEIEQRWRDSSIVHPMITLAIGTVSALYRYARRRPDGIYENVIDGPGTARTYTLAFGLEASLFKYAGIYALAGVRNAGQLTLVGVEPGGFSGRYAAIGMGFGKFR